MYGHSEPFERGRAVRARRGTRLTLGGGVPDLGQDPSKPDPRIDGTREVQGTGTTDVRGRGAVARRRAFPDAREVELGHYEMSAHLLALEVLRRGHEVGWLSHAYFVADIDGYMIGFWSTRSNLVSSVAAKTAARKDMTSRLLRANGIAVADFRTVSAKNRGRGLVVAKRLGYPLVVKPIAGMKGRGVTVDVRSSRSFRAAWDDAVETAARRVILERYFPGREARFLMVGERSVAATAKIPPHVIGDGHRTIQQLIDAKNEARKTNPHLGTRPIVLHDHRLARLRAAGLDPQSVPSEGERVDLDVKASFSDGADSADVTEVVHPTYHDVVARVGRAFPGLELAGVDLLAHDFEQPANPQNHVVCEVNSMPALGAHHFPGVGESRDVASLIVDHTLRRAGAGDATDGDPADESAR